jgi:hypothetical protein
MLRRSFSFLLFLVTAASALAFVFGGHDGFINGSSGVVSLQWRTTTASYMQPIRIGRGRAVATSNDHGDVIWIRVTYSRGRTITLEAKQIEQVRGSSRNSTWWISESGIEYVSNTEANLRRRRYGFAF